MNAIKRRQFLKQLGIGSAAIVGGAVAGSRVAAQGRGRGGGNNGNDNGDGHDHGPRLDGPLASATVSFGAWPIVRNQPLDRVETPVAPIAPNVHALIPHTATIKAGGTVNYIIAGFHQIAVYAPGKKPDDVNTENLLPIPDAPPEVGLIDDPKGRIYRGADPIELPQDRVEVVQFERRGLYLVICAVNVHFADGMYGWVLVLR